MKKILLAFMLMGAVSISHSDVILGDFEGGDLTNWSGGWDGGTLTPSSIGATSGTGSVCLTSPNPSGWAWDIQVSGIQDFAANPIMTLDITWIASEWIPGPGGGNWVQLNSTYINSNGASGGMQLVCDDPLNPSYPGSWDPANWGDNTRTLTWDLSGYDATGATWMQILFATNQSSDYAPENGGTMGNFYIDNVRLTVPEPASMALLGLGGLLALRRKK